MSESPSPVESLPQTGQPVSAIARHDLHPVTVVLLGLVVLATAFSFAFTPLRGSQDEWWHLKTGKWICEHRSLPKYDIFTYTGENIVWHNHEWLSQVIFYQVYRWGEERTIGGLRALIAFKALLVVGVFALVGWHARLRCGNWAVALFVTLIAAEISRRTIYPRPPVFSYLFFALTLLMLSAWKSGRMRGRWLWTLVPIMVVWSNLHGMCVLGIFAVGCHFAAEVLEVSAAWVRRKLGAPCADAGVSSNAFQGVILMGGLLVVLVGAAMLNPSGYHIFLLGRKFTGDPLLRKVIFEMLPPPLPWVRAGQGGSFVFVPGYATFWVTVVLLAVLAVANRGRLDQSADYLIAGFLTYQAVCHWRHLPLFAVGSAGAMAFLLASFVERIEPRPRRNICLALAGLTLILAVTLTAVVREPQTYLVRNLQLIHGQSKSQAEYPEAMMKFIVRTRFPDRMFSQINYCGYMIWWLSPEHHKLFTDNRFDVFGSRFYPYEATVVDGRESERSIAPDHASWSDILDRYGVNFVVIERSAPLNARLRSSGNWDEVYYFIPSDARSPREGFNIWLRKDARFADVFARARENFSQEHPGWPMPGEENAD